MFLLFLQISPYYASEFELCGSLHVSGRNSSCSPWHGAFCPNATFPASITPGIIQVQVEGSLSDCNAGFHEVLMCDVRVVPSKQFRVCYGSPSKDVGGFSGDVKVKVSSEVYIHVSQLNKNYMVWGRKLDSQEDTFCNVTAVYPQGEQTLFGSFSDTQLLYTGKDLASTDVIKLNHPSIEGETNTPTFELLTSCELVYTQEGTLFSPLSTIFCGHKSLDVNDYIFLFQGISQIVSETGTFWFNVSIYNDCSIDCLQSSWRSALPPICESMISCGKNSKSHCERLDILANAFVNDHLDDEYQLIWSLMIPDSKISIFIEGKHPMFIKLHHMMRWLPATLFDSFHPRNTPGWVMLGSFCLSASILVFCLICSSKRKADDVPNSSTALLDNEYLSDHNSNPSRVYVNDSSENHSLIC